MTYRTRLSRYQVVFGAVGLVVAAVGFFQARDLDFMGSRGAEIGWGSYELHLMTYNRLGATVAMALAIVGLVAGLTRHVALGWAAAVGYAAIFLQGLVQDRPEGDNVFGAGGQTITFSLALALLFGVTALFARFAETVDNT